jgi:hypothetical protein
LANVEGKKQLPFPKGRGTCPCCGGLLIAKCGQIVTHHWAHDAKDDCDPWSEPIGPWHLWWQNLVRMDFVEVTRGPHRADIVGNGNVVIELQHSSISAEDIEAREAYYGNMAWLFDATQRFASVNLGGRSFFSLGKTKHLELCKKPVFLDFGLDILEVGQFSDAITMVSGYGMIRSREWFANTFLSNVRQPESQLGTPFVPEERGSTPWDTKSPIWKLRHDTQWIDPGRGQVVTYPKWTEYIKLNYTHWRVGDSQNKWYDYDLLIDRHPDIANGWTKDGLRQMKDFLRGTAIILGGLLRVLPSPASVIPAPRSVDSAEHLLAIAEGHILAGRLPVLKPTTKSGLIEKAKKQETQFNNGLTSRKHEHNQSRNEQPSLFE